MIWTIGVDPGKTGAIALLSPSGETAILDISYGGDNWPDTDNILRFMDSEADKHRIERFRAAAVEVQHAFPGQGVVSSAQIVGSWRQVREMIHCQGISIEDVPAKKWQAAMGVVVEPLAKAPTLPETASAAERQAAKKARSKLAAARKIEIKKLSFSRAQALFPTAELRTWRQGRADALLMAEYARRLCQ